ncbi:MAG: GYD domain-containing protein [Acidobacteria bacterium]|nr:GYD domain-containing protein [Acidobacteriota bacterium]MDW7985026.1 GYD domain-containing protein [Acidobacteriota bacterium]
MPTYILVTKLAPEAMRDLKRREELGRQWREKVKENCPGVKFIAHYAILGHYDFFGHLRSQ